MNPMAEQAALGQLALQRCRECATVQYPPRELCVACLSDALEWRTSDAETGELLAITTLHHSHDAAFRNRLPLHVGLVRLDAGPTAVCFLAEGCLAGQQVRVSAALDDAGRPILTARAVPPPAAAAAPHR
jgi:uncharacterized OB-fold protein